MAERAFRFSMGIHSAKSRTTLQDKAKRYEDFGFDALHLPDHLGAPAPFPVLTAIASATSTVRLGTYVLP
jgi:alkanesulfonate monooxygenase SsuD/methylene tetrahydromethanopterin reductase-like flavin-dependent oxidoreductase (luciferase family)